jgi:hypothetical protein
LRQYLLSLYLLDNGKPIKVLITVGAELICLTMAHRRFEQLVAASAGLEKSLEYHNTDGLPQESEKYGIIMSGIQLDGVQTIKLGRLSNDKDSEILCDSDYPATSETGHAL